MTNKITATDLIEEITSIIATTADLHKALDLLTDTLDDHSLARHSLARQIIMEEIQNQHEALDKVRNKLYIRKDPLK